MKYTQWFDIKTTCPDKEGCFELCQDRNQLLSAPHYSKWDGKWNASSFSLTEAEQSNDPSFGVEFGVYTHWRGLATKDGK